MLSSQKCNVTNNGFAPMRLEGVLWLVLQRPRFTFFVMICTMVKQITFIYTNLNLEQIDHMNDAILQLEHL